MRAPKRPTDTRSMTEALLGAAESAEAKARTTRDAAAAQAAHAKREFFEEQSSTKRQTKRLAEEDLEAAEHGLAVATERLAQAKRSHDSHVREEKLRLYEERKATAVALGAEVTLLATGFAELDAQLVRLVLDVVRAVARAGDAYVDAENFATELGLSGDLDRSVQRPDVAEARLQIQKLLTAARIEAEREDVSGWLQGVADDWRTKGRTAKIQREMVVMEKTKAEQEQAARLALAHAIGASQAPPPRQRAPLTTVPADEGE